MKFIQDFRHEAYPARRAFTLAWRLTAFTTLASLVSHVVGLFYTPRSKCHIAFSGEGMTIYRRYKKIQRFSRIQYIFGEWYIAQTKQTVTPIKFLCKYHIFKYKFYCIDLQCASCWNVGTAILFQDKTAKCLIESGKCPSRLMATVGRVNSVNKAKFCLCCIF